MKIAGIIAEYNPFHTGHAYQIQRTKEAVGADFVIAVISGDFVQRGAPAFLPKHIRAGMALAGGADLVFELPATNACTSAEFFAAGGVSLLNGLGCTDVLSFGSESGNIRLFETLGAYLAEEPEIYRDYLSHSLRKGLSYPAARQKALLYCLHTASPEYGLPSDDSLAAFLAAPNNILGIEYCKALIRQKSSIEPFTVQRKGSPYHDTSLSSVSAAFPSASAIRKNWDSSDPDTWSLLFPPAVYSYLQTTDAENLRLTEEDFSLPLRWLLYSISPEELSSFLDFSPQLADRIRNTRNQYESFLQYVSLLKTKELTYTRISRALFHALLNIRKVPPISYARLLGFQKNAACVLTEIKKRGTLPLLTSLSDAPKILDASALTILEANTRIANLSESVLCHKTGKPFVHEYSRPLIIF